MLIQLSAAALDQPQFRAKSDSISSFAFLTKKKDRKKERKNRKKRGGEGEELGWPLANA